MSDEPVISVQNVSKAYRIWETPADRLFSPMQAGLAGLLPADSGAAQALKKRAARSYRDFYALRDISFEVKRGESVGIIGRNGSGKSTLLQIIAGTLQPTAGSVKVRGKVAALLELGSGFNPEFSGRENVYLNGAVQGLSRAEIDARFDDIAAFADIGEFIEQPVKIYSSGMALRLAFAVSINVSADIIIVDEALSVGDMNFQAKCITALRQLQDGGTTFLIVSHGIDTVKSMCVKAVYLREARLCAQGTAGDVADLYQKDMRTQLSAEIARSHIPNLLPTHALADLGEPADSAPAPTFRDNPAFRARVAPFRSGTGEAEITDVELLDSESHSITAVQFDQKVTIRLHLHLKQDLDFAAGYHIRDKFNLSLLASGTYMECMKMLHGRAGDCLIVDFTLSLPIRHGRYSIMALVSTNYIVNKAAQFVDLAENAVVFEVLPREPQILWAPVYINNELKVWPVCASNPVHGH